MITIYGKSSCPWCDRAKELAEAYKFEYEYKSVDHEYYLNELKEIVPNAKTVPQIIWNGNVIGGYNDFATEIENTRSFGDGQI